MSWEIFGSLLSIVIISWLIYSYQWRWVAFFVVVFVIEANHNAREAHAHTHEAIEILAAMNGGERVFNDDGTRR